MTIFMNPNIDAVEVKDFYADDVAEALRDCIKEGYQPAFAPSLIDARVNASDTRIWQKWHSTLSIKATGRTRQGNPVVIYAHCPNYFSDADNIARAKRQGTIGGAGRLPRGEFQRLLELEDNINVFVVGYGDLRNHRSGIISVKDALKHPKTIPYLCGEERAERYMKRFEEVHGNRILVWYCNDLFEEPVARMLSFGSDYVNALGGDDFGYLDGNGHFMGLRTKGTNQSKQPNLEIVMAASPRLP